MNVYSFPVTLHATAYAKGLNPTDAARSVQLALTGSDLEITRGATTDGEVEFSGAMFDDPDLPDVSLSPAITVGEIDVANPECVEGDDEVDQAEPTDVLLATLSAALGEAAASPLVDALTEALEAAGYVIAPAPAPALDDDTRPLPGDWINTPPGDLRPGDVFFIDDTADGRRYPTLSADGPPEPGFYVAVQTVGTFQADRYGTRSEAYQAAADFDSKA